MNIVNEQVCSSPDFSTRFVDTLAFIADSIIQKISQIFCCKVNDATQDFYATQLNARVVHIGQLHWSQNSAKEGAKKIWNSQKEIVALILADPNRAVFVEGVSAKYLESENYQKNAKKAKELFPTGLPEYLNQLSSPQKDFFIFHGAAMTLKYLGIIETVYPTITPQEDEDIANIVEPALAQRIDILNTRLKPLIFDRREQAVVKEVQNFFAQEANKDRKITIIYGAAHNFEKYFTPGSIQYISECNQSFLWKCELSMAGIKPH